MAFPALLDTNVLFSATLNDTLLRLAEEGAFHPLWSADILAAFPTAEVMNCQDLVCAMTCQWSALMRSCSTNWTCTPPKSDALSSAK